MRWCDFHSVINYYVSVYPYAASAIYIYKRCRCIILLADCNIVLIFVFAESTVSAALSCLQCQINVDKNQSLPQMVSEVGCAMRQAAEPSPALHEGPPARHASVLTPSRVCSDAATRLS